MFEKPIHLIDFRFWIPQKVKDWVMDHLGHTMNVHRIHYRQTSDVLERVDIAKILLIQDLGFVSNCRGKRLQDIQIEGRPSGETV